MADCGVRSVMDGGTSDEAMSPECDVNWPQRRTIRAQHTPALRQWRHELSEGSRTRTTFDWLWEAACEEMAAVEMEQDGLPELAETCRKREKAILRSAADKDGTAA